MQLLYSNLYTTNNWTIRVEGHTYNTEEDYESHKNMWIKSGFKIDYEVKMNEKRFVRYVRKIKNT